MSNPINKVTVVGAGYVGMSISVLLAIENEVTVIDIDKEKLLKIKNRLSTVDDKDITNYLNEKTLNLRTTDIEEIAYKNAEYIVIATPTNYDTESGSFDLSSIFSVLDKVFIYNKTALIVIKSTIPIGFTDKLREKYKTDNIIFSPEFLREGFALYDNLSPSRIIIGGERNKLSQKFLEMLEGPTINAEYKTFFMPPKEAESVKLFSNTYLALRIAYFNELDTFAMDKGLNTENIIEGVCADPRIGNYYNNPSFGYGGYCLPKDTRQLLSNFKNVPQDLIKASVDSNKTRKEFIAKTILDLKPNCVGIYRLTMKHSSDNIRNSSIFDIIEILVNSSIRVLVYEPIISNNFSSKFTVIDSLNEFKEKSDIVITNRLDDELSDISNKVFTRDIFNTDK